MSWRLASGGLALVVTAGSMAAEEGDPFAFYRDRDTRPLATIIATDYTGYVDAGVRYVSEDSFNFGRYNGLSEDGAYADLNMDLRGDSDSGWLSGLVTRWRFAGQDLGLDTRQLELTFGRAADYDVLVGFDQQKQVLNDTGRTPFRGGAVQTLPEGWVAANITGGMSELFDVSRQFDQELERDRFRLAVSKQLGAWRIAGGFATEEKSGDQLYGGALYADASNGHAVVLPRKVDYTTNSLDLSVGFARDRLNVDVSYLYSDFDNGDDALTWQNPYNQVFGVPADYPDGFGRLALEPDNEMHRVRAVGAYRFSNRLRLRFDGSYAQTTQDQSFLPFTVNDLPGAAPLPRNDLNGEVNVGTVNASLHFRPQALPRLTLEASYHLEDRDNDGPRNGYNYVRGDVWAPADEKLTVYNTTHDRTVNRFELEGAYRLPWRGAKLRLGYGYEEVERYNAAVEETEEDIFSGKLTLRPWQAVDARLELTYRDRGASRYQWDQSFFALLDADLINEIPDNQRYINHPLLSQYYLSNREQIQAKFSLGYTPGERWQLRLDASYAENDYDATDLGLEEDELANVTLTAAYSWSPDLSGSVFYSYDSYEAEQSGRAFRGGIEKNAFATEPPLPQASDPSRNWRVEPEDEVHSVGVNARWSVIRDRLEMQWEYSFYDAEGQTSFATFGAPDLEGAPLPDNTSKQHRLRWVSTYHLREALSLDFEYQYYRFEADDWALDGVSQTTLDKVLWTGQRSPSDVVNVFMIKAQYRMRQ